MNGKSDFESKQILIVDDDALNRKMLLVMLQKMAIQEVIEAREGNQALELASAYDFDLILLDIMMPGLDGIEVCRRLKQDEKTKDVPVIFLSAMEDGQTKSRGFEAGGVDYVSKPFDKSELKSRIFAHLALKERTDMLQGRSDWLQQEVQKRTRELEGSREELRRNNESLQTINEILTLSLQELRLEEILDQTLERILANQFLTLQDCGWIYLFNPEAGTFELVSAHNPQGLQEPGCASLPPKGCECAGEKARCGDILMSAERVHNPHCRCPRNVCCVSIFFGDRMLGVLVLCLHDGQQLNDRDRKFFASVSRTLAGIVVRKNIEQARQESELLYRAIFETTQNATCIIEQDGTIGLSNTAFSSLSQIPKERIDHTMHWQDFVHKQDQEMVGMYRELRARDPKGAPGSYEFRFVNSQNAVRQVISTADLIPGTKKTVVSLLDVTEQKHFEAELERRALYDTMTGLPNRSLFRSILERLVQRKKQHARSTYAVLFLDLDRFSLLNESLGHASGDLLLKKVAERLRETVGSDETVSRFSSDEFIILLENVEDYAEVVMRAENIRSCMNQGFVIGREEVHTTCCIGIAMPSETDEYTRADDVIRDAEMAMQRAKQEGLNSIKAFSPTMHEQTTKFLSIERELHQALKADQFTVFFQPVVKLSDLSLKGFEGLVRWEHPVRGLVSPGEFIPIAEETDLILPIGKRVLQLACDQLGLWLRTTGRNDLFVSINLSAKQFQEQDLVQTISEMLDQANVPATNIKLEITETVIMSDVQRSSAILEKMQAMGIQLAIDDFGTGYSSLSYLQSFPIDYIKIDRSFVWGMEENEQNIELIRAIVAMGHSLDHRVIAEGIESPQHVELLQSVGCDLGQGFYFAKPMPAREAQAYMASLQSPVFPD